MNLYKLPSFDDMIAMAQNDPEAFEAMRNEAIETTILSAPERSQRRLRGLQFQMDADRQLASSEFEAMLRSNKRLMKSYQALRQTMDSWEPRAPVHPAQVISISRR